MIVPFCTSVLGNSPMTSLSVQILHNVVSLLMNAVEPAGNDKCGHVKHIARSQADQLETHQPLTLRRWHATARVLHLRRKAHALSVYGGRHRSCSDMHGLMRGDAVSDGPFLWVRAVTNPIRPPTCGRPETKKL